MTRVQIRFDEDEFRRLEKQAATEGCTTAAFIRQCVKQTLDDRDHSSSISSVMAIAGKYRSGHKDLSRNHNAYLSASWGAGATRPT